MEATYKFSAYNTESVYGYVTEVEADRYLDLLNKGREVNLFEMESVSLAPDEDATVNLCDALQDLEATK